MAVQHSIGFISSIAQAVQIPGRHSSPHVHQSASVPSSTRVSVGSRSMFLGTTPLLGRPGTKTVSEMPQQATVHMSAITPEIARIGVAVYAVLMAGGGVGAFLKSGSKPSLISGVVAGILLGVAYAKDNVIAALVLAAVLGVVFSLRLVKTKKFMPAGLLLILSVGAAAFFAASIYL